MKNVYRDVKEHPTEIINCKKKEKNTITEKKGEQIVTQAKILSHM